MRSRSVLASAVLGAVLALASCTPSHKHAKVTTTNVVHVREVRNTTDDSVLWWYVIYSDAVSNSCPCYIASSPTRVSDTSSLNFASTYRVPAAAGNSAATATSAGTRVEEEQTEEVEVDESGEPADADAADAAEGTDGAAGDGAGDAGADAGGDAGGGDAGGGDAGGGGDGGGE